MVERAKATKRKLVSTWRLQTLPGWECGGLFGEVREPTGPVSVSVPRGIFLMHGPDYAPNPSAREYQDVGKLNVVASVPAAGQAPVIQK